MAKYNKLSKIRRKKSSNYRHFEEGFINIYENKLKRAFQQEEANKVWLTDITEYKTAEGVLYLSALIDCHRSRLVSYKYSTNNNVNLVLETVKAALSKSESREVVLHSDRGFQYTGFRYSKLAKEHELELSMSAAATPKDNAPMESFFSSLKTECLYVLKPKTIQGAKDLIDEYAYYYNHQRVILKYQGVPIAA
jgi:transposase InsO family protein